MPPPQRLSAMRSFMPQAPAAQPRVLNQQVHGGARVTRRAEADVEEEQRRRRERQELGQQSPQFARYIAGQDFEIRPLLEAQGAPSSGEEAQARRESAGRQLAMQQLLRVPGQAEQAQRSLQMGLARGRSTQGALTEQLLQASTGQVPSAAELQQQAGLERILRGQVAAAASARGVPPALALRQAQQAGEQASLEGLQQAAQLRAQEQAGARAQLAGVLEQTQRGQLAQAMFGQQAQQSEIAQQIQLQNLMRAQEQDPFARQMAEQALINQRAGMQLQGDMANQQFWNQLLGAGLGAGGTLATGGLF